MNKYLRLFLIFLFSVLILLIGFSFLYRNNVLENLVLKRRIVDSKWSDIYGNCGKRVVLLKAIDSFAKSKSVYFASLDSLIISCYKNRNLYKNEFSLDFLKGEFDLNNEYLIILAKYKSDSLLRHREEQDLIKELNNDDKIINKTIDEYNNSTLEYNQYISIFPNFIYAKKNGFIKRKFFTLKYGIKNEDPIVKSKELPEWAKDVDTL
jgi:hypothetical protein